MESLSKIWDWILVNWGFLAVIFSGIFYLHKIRAEEALRTKLGLVLDAYVSFAKLNDALQRWAHPLGFKGEDKDKNFNSILETEGAKATEHFQKATILLHPKTVEIMSQLFKDLNAAIRESGIHKMYLGASREAPGAYGQQLTNCYEKYTQELPGEVKKSLAYIQSDFMLPYHGWTKMLMWKITGPILLPLGRKIFKTTPPA